MSSNTHIRAGASFSVVVSETFPATSSPCDERFIANIYALDKGDINKFFDGGLRHWPSMIDFADNSDKQALSAIPQFPLIEHRASYRRE